MEIKKIANNVLNFGINRVIEIVGICIVITGVLLFTSLISFSPDDPNFIFPNNSEIQNLLGFQGSFVADLFFQSFGLISLLIPITFILIGIIISINKNVVLLIESLFYTILYSLFGSLFFSIFYPNAFNLYINGNGGFVGVYLKKSFFNSLINIQPQVFYYILIIIILSLFLISIKFKLSFIISLIKKISENFLKEKSKNYTKQNEIIDQFIPQEEIKNLIQEDLPFIKNDSKNIYKKTIFNLPSINLLKIPSKNEKEQLKNEDYIDSDFL